MHVEERQDVKGINAMESHGKSEAVLRVLDEHEALRNKLRQIHAVLGGSEPSNSEVGALLNEFQTALTMHFENEEEAEGFFNEVTSQAPRLADRAGKLCIEHQHLLHEADELCRFAAAGSPSMQWWRELKSRCHAFSKQLMHHESEEHELLQETHQDDLGTND